MDECNQALHVLGYNESLITGSWLDRPKGCVIGDINGDGIYTDSYFNNVAGQQGAKFKSMCFKGIQILSCGTVILIPKLYFTSNINEIFQAPFVILAT